MTLFFGVSGLEPTRVPWKNESVISAEVKCALCDKGTRCAGVYRLHKLKNTEIVGCTADSHSKALFALHHRWSSQSPTRPAADIFRTRRTNAKVIPHTHREKERTDGIDAPTQSHATTTPHGQTMFTQCHLTLVGITVQQPSKRRNKA